jgi:hypothetical protein
MYLPFLKYLASHAGCLFNYFEAAKISLAAVPAKYSDKYDTTLSGIKQSA